LVGPKTAHRRAVRETIPMPLKIGASAGKGKG
jgi:hypothetical protein